MSTKHSRALQSYCKVCGTYDVHDADTRVKFCGTCGCEELVFQLPDESASDFTLRVEYRRTYSEHGLSFGVWKQLRFEDRITFAVLAFVAVIIVVVIILES